MSKSLKEILKISNVLYIDDINSSSSEKVLKILKLFFAKVTTCNNYKDSLKQLENNKFDAIISEIELKDKSGITLIKKIRETDTQIPIAIISSNKEEKNLFEAIRLNLVDYLVKPVNADELIFVLNTMAKKIFNNGNIIVNINDKLSYSFLDKQLSYENKKLSLTKNEVKLLELLILNKDKTVTKNDIEYHIWENEVISESAFKSLFLRLRNKIGKETIVNNFGVGYSISIKGKKK